MKTRIRKGDIIKFKLKQTHDYTNSGIVTEIMGRGKLQRFYVTCVPLPGTTDKEFVIFKDEIIYE